MQALKTPFQLYVHERSKANTQRYALITTNHVTKLSKFSQQIIGTYKQRILKVQQ